MSGPQYAISTTARQMLQYLVHWAVLFVLGTCLRWFGEQRGTQLGFHVSIARLVFPPDGSGGASMVEKRVQVLRRFTVHSDRWHHLFWLFIIFIVCDRGLSGAVIVIT